MFSGSENGPFFLAPTLFLGSENGPLFFVALLWIRVAGQANGPISGARKRSHWVRKTDPVLVSENGPDFRVGYHRFCTQFSGGQVRHGRARRGYGRSRVWKVGGRHEEHRVSVGSRGMDGGVVPWTTRGLMCFVVLLWWADGGARAVGCAVLADRRAVTVCFGNRLE